MYIYQFSVYYVNSNYIYFFRGFSLHDALAMIEDEDIEAESITLLPPTNACGNVTDEDSGDEDQVDINNLPGSLMQSSVEINIREQEDMQSSDDDIPLSEIRKKCVGFNKKEIKKKKVYQYIKEDIPLDTYTFPKNNDDLLGHGKSPTELFFNFFDNDILCKITEETNRYSQQKNTNVIVNMSEIKAFLGILILSGYLGVSRRRMYWENSKDTHNTLVAEAISRDKFEYIMTHIHFADNLMLDKNDKFAKLRPLFDHLNKRFLEKACPEEHHSVDEAMIPYNGRHGCKQYIHGKPIRYGFKFWVGATRLGYINWFEPYQGASTYVNELYKPMGVGATVVLTYADKLIDKWPDIRFHLFFDNFFSSPILFERLHEKGLGGTGTVRENRIPNLIIKDTKILKKEKRGAFDFAKIRDKNIIFIKWNDNNVVTFGSTVSGIAPANLVKRYSQKEKKYVYIDQPQVVQQYNKNMGGVDRSDQNIAQYRVNIRGKKWYFSMISHCVDMALTNAWHIYKKGGNAMDQLSFRRSVATTILEQNKKNFTHQKGRQRNNADLRYDRLDHLVFPQDKQTRCGQCHNKTTTRCRKCDIGLHVKCFIDYHTP